MNSRPSETSVPLKGKTESWDPVGGPCSCVAMLTEMPRELFHFQEQSLAGVARVGRMLLACKTTGIYRESICPHLKNVYWWLSIRSTIHFDRTLRFCCVFHTTFISHRRSLGFLLNLLVIPINLPVLKWDFVVCPLNTFNGFCTG